MESSTAEKLFNAILKDNLSSFEKCIQSEEDLKLRFGRFPLLSVLYLFKSYNILNKYEEKLFKVKDFEEQFEFFEIYKRFKKYAGRSLRLFLEQDIISPLETLAIMDERRLLVQVYGRCYKNDKIIASIKNIYLNSYGLSLCCNDSAAITVDKKPLSRPQRVSVAICCAVFAVLILLNTIFIALVTVLNGLGSSSAPIRIDSASEFKDALADSRNFVLTSDIYLSEPFTSQKFDGTIDGAGHSVFIESGTCLTKNLAGEIKNLKLVYGDVSLELSDSRALFAESVSGKITDCSVTGSAELEFNGTDVDTFFAVFAARNEGTILGCESKVTVTATNLGEYNAYVSAFAGENYGTIKDCINSGNFVSDTVDLAGIAAYNLRIIEGCKNMAGIEQESAREWNPNCAGIVMGNYGEITACENHGDIRARLSLDSEGNFTFRLYCCGIACTNYTYIEGCKNYGKISAESKIAEIYCGGLVALNTCIYVDDFSYSMGTVQNCTSVADCEAIAESASLCCGGDVAFNAGQIIDSSFEGSLHIGSEQQNFAYAGGICGYNGLCEIRRDGSELLFNGGTGMLVVGSIMACRADVMFESEIKAVERDTIFAGIACSFVSNLNGEYVEFAKTYLKSNSAVQNSTYTQLVVGRSGSGEYLDLSAFCAEFVS